VRKVRHHLNTNIYLSALIIAVITFGLSARIAANGQIPALEEQVFFWFYNLPASLTPLMVFITLFGSGWVLFCSVLGAATLRRRALAIELFLTGGFTYILIESGKLLIDRARPFLLLSDVQSRDIVVTGLGFPSGHTAIATALSLTLLAYLSPRRWWIPAIWIILVAISRMYLGVHSPLDILGGLSIGVAVICLQQIFLRVYKTKLKRL
jgi:glycosyltransferase 2 family protein